MYGKKLITQTYLSDKSEAAGRELLVVHVVAGHGVRVHQVGAALKTSKIKFLLMYGKSGQACRVAK